MTKKADAKQKAEKKRNQAILDAIPTTWLDPLLTGPDAIAKPPYTCTDIERLMNAVRERVKAIVEKPR